MKRILVFILVLVSFKSFAQPQWHQYWDRIKGQFNADTLYVTSSHSIDSKLVLLAKDSTGKKVFHVKLPKGLQQLGYSLNSDYTDVGNVGAGEDDLITYSVPAAQLAVDGDYIEFEMVIDAAVNANAKTIKVYFGSENIFSVSANAAGGTIYVKGKVIRTGATTQEATYSYVSANSGVNAGTAALTQTLSGAITLKGTGEGVSDDDIVMKSMTVKFFPN